MLKGVIAFLLCFLFAFSAMAGDLQRKAITYKGTPGFFFSEPVADKILLDLEAYKVQTERIQLLNTKLELTDENILLLESGIKLADGIAERYQKNYELEHQLRLDEGKAYEKRLAKKNAWYKHPLLYFGIGFVTASALSVGIAFSLQEARSN